MKMKILIGMFLMFLTVESFACCGCSIVNASLNSINNTFQSSINSYDNTNAQNYETTVIKSLESDLKLLTERFKELSNNIGIDRLSVSLEEDCKNEIKKFIELESIMKTQKIIYNFERNQ